MRLIVRSSPLQYQSGFPEFRKSDSFLRSFRTARAEMQNNYYIYGFAGHQLLYGWTQVMLFSYAWITVQKAEACTAADLARLCHSVYQRRLQLMN
jgi:hypothetical protein